MVIEIEKNCYRTGEMIRYQKKQKLQGKAEELNIVKAALIFYCHPINVGEKTRCAFCRDNEELISSFAMEILVLKSYRKIEAKIAR